MRIVRFVSAHGPRVGVVDGEQVTPVADGPAVTATATVVDLAMAANADPDLRPEPIGDPVPLAGLRLLAPVPQPGTIRDFYAFEQHVRTARARRGLDMHPDWYELPVFFFSNPYAVLGPGDPVAAPTRSHELDFELEVGLVIGHAGRDVPAAEASAYAAGFVVMNDWSARDIQRREMALSMGPVKGKDFATSLGPMLVTAAEFAPGGLREVPPAAMTARVNGVEYSRADLAEIWWSFAEMIAYASEAADVRPGDVLGSGTCGSGCILELSLVHGPEKFPYLRPGDDVELEVDGLGVLANHVVAGDSLAFTPDSARHRPGIAARVVAAASSLRELAGRTSGGFRTGPDPATGEQWDVGQALAHCAEFVPYWVAQARHVIDAGGGGVAFGRVRSDPERIAVIERDRRIDPGRLLDQLDAEVARAAEWYAARTPDEIALTGRHSTLGEMTVARIVEHFLAEHLEEHAAQLR